MRLKSSVGLLMSCTRYQKLVVMLSLFNVNKTRRGVHTCWAFLPFVNNDMKRANLSKQTSSEIPQQGSALSRSGVPSSHCCPDASIYGRGKTGIVHELPPSNSLMNTLHGGNLNARVPV